MLKNFVIPYILLSVTLIFAVGCSSNAITEENNQVKKDDEAEVNVLSGELVTLAVHSISIRTENGMEYCFAIDDNTQRDKENLEVGDLVEVSYSTNMTFMAKSIEITES